MKEYFEASAVWLRRIGDHVQVLVEQEGQWKLVIQEHFDGPFSHIAEAKAVEIAPLDKVTSTR